MPTIQDYYNNKYQYALEDYTTSTPEGDQQAVSYNVGFIPDLFALRARVRSGQASDWDREWYGRQEAAARAIPLRDVGTLTYNAGEDAPDRVSGGSPDLGNLMLTLAERIEQGTATPQERDLFQTTYAQLADQNWRASVPQPSDAFNPMGDNFFGALSMLALGATGGMAVAPLAAGEALTLGSAAGLAGTAGTMSTMLATPLDQDWMRQMGLALGAAGGLAGMGSLASGGLNSIGDYLSMAQKAYGVGSKAMGMASSMGGSGAQPATGGDAGRQLQSRSQSRTATGGGSPTSSGSTGGGMDFSQLGSVLMGVVGLAGTGMTIADTSRYMEQLKDQFGDQQEIKDMIDAAYRLAVARYETQYARSETEYGQKQEAYRDALEKYHNHYGQTQREQQQKEQAYAKGEGQTDEDRATQYEHYRDQRARHDQSYQQRVQEAAQDRDRRITVFGEDRQIAMADYNRRVQEAQQDRQKELSTFDQQFARHMSTQDKREFEAAQERGLDLNAYVQRQAIGRTLSDPAAIKAGAEQLYQPLSALARDRVNTQTEEEMARRGVAGGGQYSNLMAAKAFAPQEQALWQNALQAYLTGQQGAVNAYGQQDMTSTPQYQWANVPNFTNSPEYRYANVPDMGGTPQYTGTNVPTFARTSAANVPGTVGLGRTPEIPTWTPPGAPGVPTYTAKPYSPYGEDSGGGGAGGGGSGIQGLMSQLTRALGGNTGLVQQVMRLFGGSGMSAEQQAAVQAELNTAMQNNDLYGFGTGVQTDINAAMQQNPDLWGFGGGVYAGGSPTFDESAFDYQNMGDIDYSMF